MRRISSSLLPLFCALTFRLVRRRSVSNGPGSTALMVTLWRTVLRDRPATNPVRPARAPFDRPSSGIGFFTAPEVMLMIRPKRFSIILSTTARISRIGVIMLPSSALIQASLSHSRKSPGGGPPALLMSMSGAGQAASAAARPSDVVMSPTTVLTLTPCALRIASAVASSASLPRAVITRFTPSRASAIAHPMPSPLLPAHTSAVLPRIPRSM